MSQSAVAQNFQELGQTAGFTLWFHGPLGGHVGLHLFEPHVGLFRLAHPLHSRGYYDTSDVDTLRIEGKFSGCTKEACPFAAAMPVIGVDGRNPFRTALKPWLKPLFVGICRGIPILAFLGCRISSIHRKVTTRIWAADLGPSVSPFHFTRVPCWDLFWTHSHMGVGVAQINVPKWPPWFRAP